MRAHLLKTAFIISLLACLLWGGPQHSYAPCGQLPTLEQGLLVLPQGQQIHVFIARTPSEHVQGLSHVRPEQFAPNQGMFFSYPSSGFKVFCMRQTHFDLDIFFLDHQMRVIAVDRNLPHHSGLDQNRPAAKTHPIYCRHVLEMRADSDLAKQIKPGMRLQWHSIHHQPFSPFR